MLKHCMASQWQFLCLKVSVFILGPLLVILDNKKGRGNGRC